MVTMNTAVKMITAGAAGKGRKFGEYCRIAAATAIGTKIYRRLAH